MLAIEIKGDETLKGTQQTNHYVKSSASRQKEEAKISDITSKTGVRTKDLGDVPSP